MKVKYRKILKNAVIAVGTVVAFDLFYITMYTALNAKSVLPEKAWLINVLVMFEYNFIPIAFLTLADYLIVLKIWKKEVLPSKKRLFMKFFLDIILSNITLVIFNYSYLYILPSLPGSKPGIEWPGTILCNTFILFGMELIYYVKRSRAVIMQSEQEKRQTLQYQYEALKAQVDPHFLFNSFSILYSLINIEPGRASEFTLKLSDIYRYILNIKDRKTVSVREELEFVNNYIEILRIRFGSPFNVDITGYNQNGEGEIIPCAMQMVVENVIKHNVISDEVPMQIRIIMAEDRITISNPINLKASNKAKATGGFGLKYLKQQYLQYGKEVEVLNDGKDFTVTIPVLFSANSSF